VNDASWTLRRADAADAASITECAVEAFRHYIPRLGLTPLPMTRDYGVAIEMRRSGSRHKTHGPSPHWC